MRPLPPQGCKEQLSLYLLPKINSKTIFGCICICYEMQNQFENKFSVCNAIWTNKFPTRAQIPENSSGFAWQSEQCNMHTCKKGRRGARNHVYWAFPCLVVSNLVVCKFCAAALFCALHALLRSFADLRSFAHICALLCVSVKDRISNDCVWELQSFGNEESSQRFSYRSSLKI